MSVQLTPRVKTILEVDLSQLEQFIAQELGHHYDISAATLSGDDTTISVTVTGTYFDLDAKAEVPGMDPDERAGVEAFIATGEYEAFSPSLDDVMQWLCCEGKIPAGEWITETY